MCNVSGIIFGVKNLAKEEVRGRKVIEVGSHDVNGSLRLIIESWDVAEYIGVDIVEGSGVDIICHAENLIEKFGKEKFDAVISTELLEHVRDWRKVITNIKNICKPDGIILITTRSYGFQYHGYPYDFWRYELDDMETLFSDCEILTLEKDYLAPGVFIKVKKPKIFAENTLVNYELYSVVVNKRVKEITDTDFRNLYSERLFLKLKFRKLAIEIIDSLLSSP